MNAPGHNELQRRLDAAGHAVPIGGRYRHYKGGEYVVVGLAIQTADDEVCVIYEADYDRRLRFSRPLWEWAETVVSDGTPKHRFAPVSIDS